MRHPTAAPLAALALILAAPAARACEHADSGCPPRTVVFPSYTPEGERIGAVEAPVRRVPRLRVSHLTGQPLTVLFNDPDGGIVDPELVLVPLPRAKPFKTQAVYPRGY